MISNIKFYNDKVAINLLAKDIENAVEVNDTLEGHGLIGVLSKDFSNVKDATNHIEELQKYIPAISVGLGAGDPKQWKMAAEIAKETNPSHVNQVFSTAGYTLGLLEGAGTTNTIVNALISPTGEVGKVRISTGPASNSHNVIVDVDQALSFLEDCNIPSVKFFNIKGNKHLAELKEVAKACVRNNIPIIEPTGGIDRSNIYEIIKVCLDAGCNKIIPHVYSSAIDKSTGLTDLNIVRELYNEMKRAF